MKGGQLRGLLGDASHVEYRFVRDLDRVEEVVSALRMLDQRIVLTSGAFDILHEGHSRYLEAACAHGTFLIVGLDSDEKVRARKGPDRPVVPERERVSMLCHQRGVGLVTLKCPTDPKWELIRRVRPDVLIATEETYTPAEVTELENQFCGDVVALPRFGTVSTTARLRQVMLTSGAAR